MCGLPYINYSVQGYLTLWYVIEASVVNTGPNWQVCGVEVQEECQRCDTYYWVVWEDICVHWLIKCFEINHDSRTDLYISELFNKRRGIQLIGSLITWFLNRILRRGISWGRRSLVYNSVRLSGMTSATPMRSLYNLQGGYPSREEIELRWGGDMVYIMEEQLS